MHFPPFLHWRFFSVWRKSMADKGLEENRAGEEKGLLFLLLLLFCPGGNKQVAEPCLSLVWRGGGGEGERVSPPLFHHPAKTRSQTQDGTPLKRQNKKHFAPPSSLFKVAPQTFPSLSQASTKCWVLRKSFFQLTVSFSLFWKKK